MRCPNCQTITGAPGWKARYHVLWANGYGNGKRVFCDACGQWTDVITKYGLSAELTKTEMRVVHPPIAKDAQS